MDYKTGTYLIEKLRSKYEVNKVDVGSDSSLKKGLLRFNIDRYCVKGIGNLCILDMHGFFGFVKMETVVLATEEVDVPLFNTDSISFGKKNVQIAELYETRINKGDGSLESKCQAVKDQDSDIEDYQSGAHNYSAELMSCSYAKTGKNAASRMAESVKAYVDILAGELESAPHRDKEAGKAKNVLFADSLIKNGGPAVSKIRKMFGEETAVRIIRNHMYGAD